MYNMSKEKLLNKTKLYRIMFFSVIFFRKILKVLKSHFLQKNCLCRRKTLKNEKSNSFLLIS